MKSVRKVRERALFDDETYFPVKPLDFWQLERPAQSHRLYRLLAVTICQSKFHRIGLQTDPSKMKICTTSSGTESID